MEPHAMVLPGSWEASQDPGHTLHLPSCMRMRKAMVRNKSGAGMRSQEAINRSPPAVHVLHQPLSIRHSSMLVKTLHGAHVRGAGAGKRSGAGVLDPSCF